MIAILSKTEFEQSTEDVIDWLTYYKTQFIRINGDEFCENIYDFNFNSMFNDVPINEINICWLRRWSNDSVNERIYNPSFISNINAHKLLSGLAQEKKSFSYFFFNFLKNKKWLTSLKEISISKLEVLFEAKKIGLDIPATIITTKKNALEKFKNLHKRIVSKNITNCIVLQNQNDIYTSMTEEIKNESIDNSESSFFLSLFQELIEKEYEIRVFFLKDDYYSMAIFSQQDTKTQIDFRNYNLKNPNRTIPYKLPNEVEAKLKILRHNLGYTTGSIDLIKSTSGKYYFLECNPVGQFGMLSIPCNYYLEQKIAMHLYDNNYSS